MRNNNGNTTKHFSTFSVKPLPLRVVGATESARLKNFKDLAAWLEEKGIAATSVKEAPPIRRASGWTHTFKLQCPHPQHGDDGIDSNPSLELYLHKTGVLDDYCPVCETKTNSRKQQRTERRELLLNILEDCPLVEPNQPPPTVGSKAKKDGCTLESLFELSPQCLEVARQLGWQNAESNGRAFVKIPYHHIGDNDTVFYQRRIALEGKQKYLWAVNAPATELLHGTKLALEMLNDRQVLFLCESPTDCVVLLALGYPAINCAGKGNAKAFAGLKGKIPTNVQVVVWEEPDAEGFAAQAAVSLQREVLRFNVKDAMAEDLLPAKDALRILQEFEGDSELAQVAIETALKKHCEPIAPELLLNLEAVLDLLEAYFRTFVKLPEHFYAVLPLWVAHTYAIDVFHFTPYLLITSPVKQCGKTLLRNTIAAVAYNSLAADNTSLAALFREVHKHAGKVTLLLDEVDRWLAAEDSESKSDFIGLLNTGFQRGSKYLRCERHKGGFETQQYEVFCPKVIVGLSSLTDTVRDRSIIVEMQRTNPYHDNLRRFPFPIEAAKRLDPETYNTIRRITASLQVLFSDSKVLDRLQELYQRIYCFKPQSNDSAMSARIRDIVEPLLAIAALAGKRWFIKALQAFQKTFKDSNKRLSEKEQVLNAVYHIAKETGQETVTTEEIFQKIADFEDLRLPADFPKWERDFQTGGNYGLREFGKWLQRVLKGFEVERDRQHFKRGYNFKDIEAAWQRYVKPYLVEVEKDFKALVAYLFNEPLEPPPDDQPPATTQQICPHCGEPLEFDADGVAACVGCGRLVKAESGVLKDEDDQPSTDGAPPTTEPPANPPPNTSSPPPAIEVPQNLFEPPTAQAERPHRLTTEEGGKILLRSGSNVVVCEPEALRSAARPIGEIPDLNLSQATTNFSKVFSVVIDIEAEPLQPDASPHDFRKQKILAIGLLIGDERRLRIIRGVNEFETLLQFTDNIRRISEIGTAQGRTHYTFVGHNLLGYDIPLLIERYKAHNLTPPFDFVVDREGKVVEVAVANTQGVISSNPLTYRKVKTQGLLAEWDFADTLHLVLKYDSVFREMTKHDLKSAAQHFGLSVENRLELSPQEIVDCFYNDPQRFEAYLKADLIEAFRLFVHLAPPYFYLAQFINSVLAAEGALKHKWKIEDAIQRSTAAMIETLLEAHYKSKPQPEDKRSYEGGLVLCRSGVYWQAAKVDIASLYPNIMLVYRIHSRKDREGWMLKVLKHLTAERLRLKAKAKEGDKEAEHMQQALKVLINSVYGFYGTGGYSFNDMAAAEAVTKYGREILTLIIYTIEEAGGVVAEADTDGVIFSHQNPQKVVEAINAALPEGFKVELEWHGCVAFISDKKNYIVFNPDSTVKEIKGAKWRGRDKPKLRTTFVVDYLREYLFNSPQAAQRLVKDIAERIYSNAALELVAVTRKVGRNEADKFLKRLGAQEGQVVTFVYTNKKKNEAAIITPETAGSVCYDTAFYNKLLAETLKEINAVLAKQVKGGVGG